MENAQLFSLPAAQSSWLISPVKPELAGDEAHIWLARLDERRATDLLEILSDDERARAGRFRFERDKKQFIAARGFLRIILGKYLKTRPEQLRFEYSEYGKPSIAGTANEIKFNLSHSDGLAFYAITLAREIGVDIERVKPDFVEDRIVSFCLSSGEIEHFEKLSEIERITFFFDCWTLKEAYQKASGDGFLIPPNEIETSLLIADRIRETQISLQKLPPISDYKAALAIEGKTPRLKFWLFND